MVPKDTGRGLCPPVKVSRGMEIGRKEWGVHLPVACNRDPFLWGNAERSEGDYMELKNRRRQVLNWSNGTARRVLSLHVADPGSISGTPFRVP